MKPTTTTLKKQGSCPEYCVEEGYSSGACLNPNDCSGVKQKGNINSVCSAKIEGPAICCCRRGDSCWYASDCGDSEICRNGECIGVYDTSIDRPDLSKCSGCTLDAKCIPIGTRYKDKYCTLEETWFRQKSTGAICENNFECVTNFCTKRKCQDIQAEMEEQKSLFSKILSWLGIM